MYGMVGFHYFYESFRLGMFWVLWYTNHCCLFNDKSCLYICISNIYDLSTHFLDRFFKKTELILVYCPVCWVCRIHRLLLCWGVSPTNHCPGYDTEQSDGEVPAMLELWGMRSSPSLPLLPGPLWPELVAPDRALSMG